MTARKPQDRLPKKLKAKKKWTVINDDGSETMADYTYTAVNGDELTVTAEELGDVLTPGFVRRHRQKPQEEISFLLIEELERDELLEILDNSWPDYKAFSESFAEYVNEFMGLSMGESKAS